MAMDISFLNVSTLTLVGVVSIIGFYMGGVARRIKLPSIIGYMVFGVLLGPTLLNVFRKDTMSQLSFITEVALGFVAFSIGSELDMASLRKLGKGIIYIIFAESFGAFFLVFLAVYALTRDMVMALVFGSMAPASAPAGTVAVIQEYKAKGSLTSALYAVVGFDDGLAIIIFGFAAALAKSILLGQATGHNGSVAAALLIPLKEIVLSILLGVIGGFLFCQIVRRLESSRDIFIIVFGSVLIVTGLSVRFHLSLIMTNMVVGFVLVNTRRQSLVNRVKLPLLEVMPLLFILFFTLAGANLEVATLPALGVVGIVYILARTGGLMGGAYLGGVLSGVEKKVKNYVGMGILSQAGVAIGLSLIVNQEFGQLSSEHAFPRAEEIGAGVLTTITATCIFFEIVGPILTRIALRKAGEIPIET